ncbi:hypothetical protein ADL03_11415 [Nocardia sp. NRRL S-836]|nr:hypothetical protein ADL03_11415 [Nocardia sp. NRRL S-836]
MRTSYDTVSGFFRDVRSFYETADLRLSSGEYGVKLTSVNGVKLFSSVDSYRLPGRDGHTGEPEAGACPYYIWFPTWLGSFYTEASAIPAANGAATNLLAFIWVWMGTDDAFVADVGGPECWFGLAAPSALDRAPELAKKIWNFFRFEWTCEKEVDGWLTGTFRKNTIGCDLDGSWLLRRLPLAELSSYYQVERLVIRPLSDGYFALAQQEARRVASDVRVRD